MEENQVNEEVKEEVSEVKAETSKETESTKEVPKAEEKEEYSTVKVVIGYLFPLIGLIFVFNSKGEPEIARKHYKQAGAAFIMMIVWSILYGVLSWIPFMPGIISTAVNGLLWVACIIGAVKGYNKEDIDLPLITEVSNKMFK